MKRPPMPAAIFSAAAGLRLLSFKLICRDQIDVCTALSAQMMSRGRHQACIAHCIARLDVQEGVDMGLVYCKHVPCLHTAYSAWACAPGEPIATRWNDRLKQEIKNSRVNMTNKLVVELCPLCSQAES